MVIHRIDQRTEEWHRLRLGRVTSSRADVLFASGRKRGSESVGRRRYRVQLALERITGRPQESAYQSDAMQQGTDREAEALAAYEAETGYLMDRVGFISHDELMTGCSPDGVLLDKAANVAGVVEVKCPLPHTHLEYLRSAEHDYLPQIHHHLWVTGAGWCDWASYCPDYPDELRLVIRRHARDDGLLAAHELAVRTFLDEVEAEVEAIRLLTESRRVLRAVE